MSDQSPSQPPVGVPQSLSDPAPPTAPRTAPQRGRVGLVVGLVVGVVLLCGLGACAAAFLAIGSSNSANKRAALQAETHFKAAMTAVTNADKSIAAAKVASTTDAAENIAVADKQLRVGRDEIAAAKVAAEQINDSQGKTDYLAGLAAANTTLDTLQDLVAYMSTTNGMAAKAVEAGALASKANAQLNQAVSRANGGSYGEMRSQAQAASTNYTKAATLFREADRIDPTAGLKKAAVYSEKRSSQADVVVRMADEGRANHVSAYDSDIKKQAALGKEAEAVGVPAIVSDPHWGQKRISVLTVRLGTTSKQADELRAKALAELGVSQ